MYRDIFSKNTRLLYWDILYSIFFKTEKEKQNNLNKILQKSCKIYLVLFLIKSTSLILYCLVIICTICAKLKFIIISLRINKCTSQMKQKTFRMRQKIFQITIYMYKYAVLFLLPLSLFYTNHLVPIIVFNYDYLNSMKILLCLCFYSLYYHFVNLNFIDNYNNLNIRLYAFWARGSRFKRRIDV